MPSGVHDNASEKNGDVGNGSGLAQPGALRPPLDVGEVATNALPLTTVECVKHADSGALRGRHVKENSCSFRNLYFRDGRFYAAVRAEGDAPPTWAPMRLCARHNNKYPCGWAVGTGPHDVNVVTLDTLVHSAAGNATLRSVRTLTVLGWRISSANHGHMMFDSTIPLNMMMDTLGVRTRDNVVVMMDDAACGRETGVPVCAMDDRVDIISQRAMVKNTHTAHLFCPRGEFCHVEHAVGGTGGFGFLFNSIDGAVQRAHAFRAYRDDAWALCGVTGEHTPYRTPFRVTIVQRPDSDARAFPDVDHVADVVLAGLRTAGCSNPQSDHLRDAYEFSVFRPHEASLCEQVRAMAGTSMLLGVDGTGMDNAIFLPDHAGVWLVQREWSLHEVLEPVFRMYLAFRITLFPDHAFPDVTREAARVQSEVCQVVADMSPRRADY